MKKITAENIGGFPTKNLNQNVRPQDDFFEYVVGGWIKNNPIPPEKSGWGTFYKLRDTTDNQLRIIVNNIVKKRSKKGSETQQLRDLFLSGLDTKKRNELDFSPLEPYFRKIDSIERHEDVLNYVTAMQYKGDGVLWGIWVGSHLRKSDENITYIDQGGLTLPDRDFYIREDKTSKSVRRKYIKHMENMFSMSCWNREDAKWMARDILELETEIAKISMDKVSRRNMDLIYNKYSLSKLQKDISFIDWKKYFAKIGLKKAKVFVVEQPEFLRKLGNLLIKTPVETWKLYLYWDVLSGSASVLSTKAEKESFDFFNKTLGGSKKMEPREKRMIAVLNGVLGDALGKEYVEKHFTQKSKKGMDVMVKNLLIAYKKRLQSLDWMSPTTKKKALRKLSLMNSKVGYPKKWKSYKGLIIKKDDYFGNLERAGLYAKKRNFSKLGKPVDKSEWRMNAQTVNAYYAFMENDIVFPASILQPPFFDINSDMAYSYGAIGTVIGHEITHGFDDQGSKFDGAGNMHDWWTKKDRNNFTKRTKKIVRQFNELKVGDLNVNGELTLGENIADFGGVAIAFDAYQEHIRRNGADSIHGFTPEQRFFMGVAVFEASHCTKERSRMLALTDPHSPAKFRVNVPLSNFDPFHASYKTKKGDKLYRTTAQRVKVW